MSLTKRLEQIEKKLEEGDSKPKKLRKPRDFRIPASGKVSPSRAKKNYVGILKLNENKHIDFQRYQIIDQTIMVDDIPRLAAAGYVWYYKKMPVIILPSWSVTPISADEEYKESLKDGSNTAGYSLLMARMKSELVKGKKKIGGLGMTIFGLVIAGVIVYALISGGGG